MLRTLGALNEREIMPIRKDIDTASEAEWAIACRRAAVLAPLLPRSSTAAVAEAALQLGISTATTYRLLARYRKDPMPSTLLPAKVGLPSGTNLLKPELEELIQEMIRSFYLKRERPRIADLHRRIAVECHHLDLRCPSYKAVWRRIQNLDPALLVCQREGAKAARERFKAVLNGPQPKRPFDLYQIDHTLVDVIVVDEVDRKPIGRPWLTIVVDVATRMIAGFHLSLNPPSSSSVALAVSHAVLAKTTEVCELGGEACWPVEGLPKVIHLDNAKEFHGKALERGCREHGIALRFRPPRMPHFGGHIERLIGTLMGDVHLLPGTTFSSVDARGNYASEARAVLTMSEFRSWLTLQIVEVYHRRTHRSLGEPPLSAWKSAISKYSFDIRRPHDVAKFYIDFLPGEHRLIRRDGICLAGIHYWDSVLSTIAARSKEKFLIRYDPGDLSHVFVKAPGESHYIKVPYRNIGRPSITLVNLKSAIRKLKSKKLSVDENAIFAAIDVQRAIVEKASKESAAARRLRARSSAVQRSQTNPSLMTTDISDETPVSVEPYPVEIWE
jgi:putative transposase